MYRISIDSLGAEHIQRINADGSVSTIPVDDSLSAYRQYLDWLAEGNKPTTS